MNFVGWRSCGLRGALLLGFLGSSGMALAAGPVVTCAAPPSAAGGAVNKHTRFVEQNLFPAVMQAGAKPLSLFDRMQAYGVPGISVAVIHNGKVDWARGWGVRDARNCKPVTADTAFQAASISKVVTAVLGRKFQHSGTKRVIRMIFAPFFQSMCQHHSLSRIILMAAIQP